MYETVPPFLLDSYLFSLMSLTKLLGIVPLAPFSLSPAVFIVRFCIVRWVLGMHVLWYSKTDCTVMKYIKVLGCYYLDLLIPTQPLFGYYRLQVWTPKLNLSLPSWTPGPEPPKIHFIPWGPQGWIKRLDNLTPCSFFLKDSPEIPFVLPQHVLSSLTPSILFFLSEATC